MVSVRLYGTTALAAMLAALLDLAKPMADAVGVLVTVQAIASPLTGVTLIGKLVKPVTAVGPVLLQATVALYCARVEALPAAMASVKMYALPAVAVKLYGVVPMVFAVPVVVFATGALVPVPLRLNWSAAAIRLPPSAFCNDSVGGGTVTVKVAEAGAVLLPALPPAVTAPAARVLT